GKVDDGSTVCDFEPEEIKRHMSLSLALAPCILGDVKLNIIDTPGYADFFGEVRAAASVVDLVVIVVGAVEGIEAQTEAVWDLATELGLPRLVFINKLDRERASFDRTLSALQERFGAGIAPLELPVGEEAGFRGIADLLTDSAIIYENGTPRPGPIPDDLAAVEHEVREQLVEGIVVGDDGLMERYLEGEALSGAELEATLASGVAQGLVFPVVCGSAVTGVGIDRLATLLAEIAPTPDSRPPVEVQAGEAVSDVACDPAGPPLAQVFKTISDPYVGKISLLRVLSGTIKPDTMLIDPRTHTDQRLHLLQLLRGKEAQPVDEAQAGDIVAVPKLTDTATGDTLAPKGTPVVVPMAAAEPVALSVAIRPKSKGDEDKLMT
ncbi:MAG: GTP-binding protein, partial [Acidimicrobiales bacterium]